MDWLDAVSKAVSEGKTKFQFAVPDGVYIGDLYFITDSKHRIIVALCWTGNEWITEHTVMNIEL